jgi:methylenetetrahydrofolate reductase (NADH)
MIQQATSGLFQRIEGGKTVLLAEISPPPSADPAEVRAAAKRCAGKVHAVGISDNRERVAMSALAAATLVASEGLEPILHLTTRDRNRVALVSEVLGAQALGISNLLCTSGTHQTLGRFRAAKNVYDIDSVQLLQTVANLAGNGALVGEDGGLAGTGPFCLGAVASPDADPLPLQITRLAKKAQAGAKFLVTQPVYDLDRFGAWWQEVTRRGIHEKVAIVAGIQPLSGEHARSAQDQVGDCPSFRSTKMGLSPSEVRGQSRIPESLVKRIQSAASAADRRAAAVKIAVETIERLSAFKGLRGFCVSGDGDLDAALEVIEKSGLRSN